MRIKGVIGILAAVVLTAAPVHAGTLAEYHEDVIAIMEHNAVEAMRKVWNIEEGQLEEGATKELLAAAEDKADSLPDENEHKENLEIMAKAAAAELAKPKTRLYGVCTITRYCNCAQCCGPWAGGNCASGVPPVEGVTVAHNYLPFGTIVIINGHEYIVQDRGDENMAGGDWFDIYVNDHRTATGPGMYTAEVYIVE